jgi:hypothetical protein
LDSLEQQKHLERIETINSRLQLTEIAQYTYSKDSKKLTLWPLRSAQIEIVAFTLSFVTFTLCFFVRRLLPIGSMSSAGRVWQEQGGYGLVGLVPRCRMLYLQLPLRSRGGHMVVAAGEQGLYGRY